MSHFPVIIISQTDDYEDHLKPFDENLECLMHLTKTRQQLIDDERSYTENYKNTIYAEYLEDKKGFLKAYAGHNSLIQYVQEVFPKRLKWTDEEAYQYAISDYKHSIERGEGCYEIHSDGSLWSVFNDNAKFDWYQLGGRWRGLLKLKKPNPDAPLYTGWQYHGATDEVDKEYEALKKKGFCDQAQVKDISNLDGLVDSDQIHAIIKEREWYERGKMGWWAVVTDEKPKDVWQSKLKKLLEGLDGEMWISIVDCHY